MTREVVRACAQDAMIGSKPLPRQPAGDLRGDTNGQIDSPLDQVHVRVIKLQFHRHGWKAL